MDNGVKKGILQYLKNIISSSQRTIARIDLNRYTDIEDMYGYIGFIDKDGGFYRVRRIGSDDCGHGEWAYYFLDKNKKEYGVRPSLKFNDNIYLLTQHPKFSMAFLYEDQLMGEDSHIESSYLNTFEDLTFKQQEVINKLVSYQNAEADSLSSKNNNIRI